ncbi:MAG: FtsX-like permease family protein [Clostridium sp.]|uniref:ABC transporter permease n=1 Tax=Clostridium sp. TaxID=1506 RepID=UPI0028FDE4D8|nr:FtsX-like permease family protein [Clostridium sp.]MDU1586187.1 FtsX-like permease family protein [Clostridium sp.]MDU1979174.1 FtsX-like permease family protein [Clostridium sp.]MDU1994478.1 FtsX-like permease family protein [Clostridium sp.]MDU6049182.1 FtsX-like permease family protein [Clostridium sp.]MDU6222665.1 FtsX-like permease family protein [Clostridium sp.]
MIDSKNRRILFKLCNEISSNCKMRNIFLTLAIMFSTSLIMVTFIIGYNAKETIKFYESQEYIQGDVDGDVNEFINGGSIPYEVSKVKNIIFTAQDIYNGLNNQTLIYEKDGIVLKKTSSPEFFKKEGINLLVGDFPKNSNDLLLSYEAYNILKGVKVGSKINVGVMIDEKGSVLQSNEFNVVGIIKDSNDKLSIYSGNMTMLTNCTMVITFLIILISFASYLIIYTILYIHVITERSTYKLLRVVGMKGRNVRKLLFYQGMKCSIIGIPLGIAIAYLISNFICKDVVNITGYTLIGEVRYPYFLIVLTLVVIAMIINFSSSKPSDTVENIKSDYSDSSQTLDKSRSISLTNGRIRLKDIAISNILSNKNRSTLTIGSIIFASIIIIFAINAYLSLDVEKCLSMFFNENGDGFSSINIRSDIIKFQNGVAKIGLIIFIIIEIIAILNITNSTLTSLISRRVEFETLMAIGMHRRDVKKLVVMEGYYTFVISSVPILIFGPYIGSYIIMLVPYNVVISAVNIFIPLIFSLALGLIINITVPYLSYLFLSKKNFFYDTDI